MLSAHRAPARSGTTLPSAAGCTGSWSTHAWIGCGAPNSHRTTPLDDVYPVPDRTAQVETAMVVQRALMRLPVEQRATIVAVDMQGYSIADTAALLGIAEGTVKSRCARALCAACPAARLSRRRRPHRTRLPAGQH